MAQPETSESVADTDPSLCPRCGAKLTNPDGLGWCPGCGYCRSLDGEGAAIAPPPPAAPRQPSALGASEFGEAMRRMPGWAWPLLGGVAVVVAGLFAADSLLPEDGLLRALSSASGMVLGVVGLVAAQLWIVFIVGAHEDGLGARDVFLAGRVWRAAFRRLPTTRKPLWLGAWGLTALIGSAAIIGGFGYWLELAQEGRVRRLAERMDDAGARKDSGRASAGAPDDGPKPGAARPGPSGPVTQCVVIGYQTDGQTVTGIVLATADAQRDQLRFAGVVHGGLTDEQRQDLMSRLSRLGRKDPLIPGLSVKGTVWVKPGVFCDVIGAGGAAEPTFKGVRD